MALVKQGYFLDVQLIDKGGNTTTRRFQYAIDDNANDITALVTAQNDLLVALQNVTQCVVKQYSLIRFSINDGLVLPTGDGAEVEKHALITAPIHGIPNKSATIDIPAPENALFVGTSGPSWNVVDTTNAFLLAYLDLFTSGEGTQAFYVSDGELIDQVNLRGKRTSSHSLKG